MDAFRQAPAAGGALPAARVTAGFQPVMPAFQGLITEEQLLALIEYVKSLSPAEQPQTQPAGTQR